MIDETVPCKWCGEETTATAIRECSGCWELRSRLETYSIHLVARIIKGTIPEIMEVLDEKEEE